MNLEKTTWEKCLASFWHFGHTADFSDCSEFLSGLCFSSAAELSANWQHALVI
jgi:hypothetical protein